MQKNPSSSNASDSNHGWLRRIWGMLPMLTFILLVGIIVVLSGWIQSHGKTLQEQKSNALRQDQSTTNVVTMELVPGPVCDRLSLPGVVRPWIELTVVAEVKGKIARKVVDNGQNVHTGDILAVIDDRDYRNTHASAQSSYLVAKATFDRLNRLLKDRVATPTQIDEARAMFETTKAAMDNASLGLERTVIRSPLDGVVDQTLVENGQYVQGGDPIAKILQIDRVKIEVGVPESDVDAVRQVKQFHLTVDALNGKTFQGDFHFLSKSAQSLARLYTLEISVDNPERDILPDMFARVNIVKQQIANGLAVPLYCLLPKQHNTTSIYLADNGKARLAPVQIGIQEGWRIQITQGVNPGDKVIVVGHRELNDGAPIKVVRTIVSLEELSQ